MSLPIDTASHFFLQLQQDIIDSLVLLEGAPFQSDAWERDQGGGGLSRYLEGGELFERAAVLFSHVKGTHLPASASARRPDLAGRPWEAMGVSLVIHPRNPFVPTTHMNVRMFSAQAQARGQEDVFWFGGGLDLTPYYLFEDDAVHFHRSCKQALDPHGGHFYPKYKRWCDEYFYLKHRNETRGIGGIFFDDLNQGGFHAAFELTQSVGRCFIPAYAPIVEKRMGLPYTQAQRDFQAYRRGRYVEFNLVFDRGTLFGLQSGGRTESILLSMPPQANWRYNWEPPAGSAEAQLQSYLQPRDWLNLCA